MKCTKVPRQFAMARTFSDYLNDCRHMYPVPVWPFFLLLCIQTLKTVVARNKWAKYDSTSSFSTRTTVMLQRIADRIYFEHNSQVNREGQASNGGNFKQNISKLINSHQNREFYRYKRPDFRNELGQHHLIAYALNKKQFCWDIFFRLKTRVNSWKKQLLFS